MFATISEIEFLSADPIFRVIVHDYPRKFGALRLPDISHVLTLSWRSDLIEPIIEIDSSLVWIGVDQRIVCVSPLGNILFSMGLDSFILQIKHFQVCTVALCETHLIAINHDSYTLRRICHLRDIPVSVEIKDNELLVKYISGEQELFSI
jgi:hypothetical protein